MPTDLVSVNGEVRIKKGSLELAVQHLLGPSGNRVRITGIWVYDTFYSIRFEYSQGEGWDKDVERTLQSLNERQFLVPARMS